MSHRPSKAEHQALVEGRVNIPPTWKFTSEAPNDRRFLIEIASQFVLLPLGPRYSSEKYCINKYECCRAEELEVTSRAAASVVTVCPICFGGLHIFRLVFVASLGRAVVRVLTQAGMVSVVNSSSAWEFEICQQLPLLHRSVLMSIQSRCLHPGRVRIRPIRELVM